MKEPLIPSMPYVPALREWLEHEDGCERCHEVTEFHTAIGMAPMLFELCENGIPLNLEVQDAIVRQHRIAAQN